MVTDSSLFARVTTSISDRTQVRRRRIEVADLRTAGPLSLLQWWRLSFLPLHIQQFSLCLPFYVTLFIVLSSSFSVSSFYLHNYTRVPLYYLSHPTTFVFLYCVVFFSKCYSSSFRPFTPYAIFFYSLLLSPPFHFPFLRNYEMDLAFILKSFASLYSGTWTIKINFSLCLYTQTIYGLSSILKIKFTWANHQTNCQQSGLWTMKVSFNTLSVFDDEMKLYGIGGMSWPFSYGRSLGWWSPINETHAILRFLVLGAQQPNILTILLQNTTSLTSLFTI